MRLIVEESAMNDGDYKTNSRFEWSGKKGWGLVSREVISEVRKDR